MSVRTERLSCQATKQNPIRRSSITSAQREMSTHIAAEKDINVLGKYSIGVVLSIVMLFLMDGVCFARGRRNEGPAAGIDTFTQLMIQDQQRNADVQAQTQFMILQHLLQSGQVRVAMRGEPYDFIILGIPLKQVTQQESNSN